MRIIKFIYFSTLNKNLVIRNHLITRWMFGSIHTLSLQVWDVKWLSYPWSRFWGVIVWMNHPSPIILSFISVFQRTWKCEESSWALGYLNFHAWNINKISPSLLETVSLWSFSLCPPFSMEPVGKTRLKQHFQSHYKIPHFETIILFNGK